jgi:hypothetical protein
MVADVLTKALAKERHQNLTRSMGLGVLDYLQSGSVEDYDVDVRNINNGVVDKCCKQSKT